MKYTKQRFKISAQDKIKEARTLIREKIMLGGVKRMRERSRKVTKRVKEEERKEQTVQGS